ncbi:M20/M25/M40 family metallo-hydrolase [Chitinophaga horti]|uniref:M20/M25/M40 family metallo-hydrolase n=1 Tax=Chitinophaga horti TaxID=2920382 RepID=A0ABY6J3Q7_9BACT|nr:M20/M25/M40 family metallo-hydrolase [Chitinophaga horti]UYQ92814.1 M20/M25/M40 family metallo-hydrolase [Chitinophaga horti]
MKTLLLLLACSGSLQMMAQKAPNVDSSLLMKDVKTLSDNKFEGRKTGTKGNRLAQFYLLDRFKQAGLQQFNNTYEQPFYFSRNNVKTMGTNLYGYIAGKSEKVIVISAHYDHVGIGRPNEAQDSIYNGADDNASGVAGLLAMAAYFKKNQPQHTLIFAAFDAEEMGLQGAKAFVAKLPVPAERIVLNINMDMISHNNKRELYATGVHHFPELRKYVEAAAAQSAISLKMGHDKPEDGDQDWTKQSDHYEFFQKKIPFLYFGVEDHPDYHKPSDEFANINPSFFYHAVQSVLNVVKEADKN